MCHTAIIWLWEQEQLGQGSIRLIRTEEGGTGVNQGVRWSYPIKAFFFLFLDLNFKQTYQPESLSVQLWVFYQSCHLPLAITLLSLAIPGLSLLVPVQSQDVSLVSHILLLSTMIGLLFVFSSLNWVSKFHYMFMIHLVSRFISSKSTVSIR